MSSGIFFTAFFQPLYNLLIGLTALTGGSIGWAIVLVTVLIRIILYPLTHQSLKAQQTMQKLQPMIGELKAKYKNNKEEFSKQLMQLYRQQNVNPFSSCLMIGVQLPILWALYRVFQEELGSGGIPDGILYSFIVAPSASTTLFLGVDLATSSIALAVVAGAAQYLQARSLPHAPAPAPKDGAGRDEQMLTMMNKQMLYFFPVITVVIGSTIPSGLTLYWAVSTFLLFLQQWWAFRPSPQRA
ncbi:MAG: hypothetical protein A3H42_01430 [Deltaproteobacteria bacterium RIFCSPLOWO2_02_FULL_46_8]|nr:MAG: hypothetical protein A3H42_01430 [Deltaproteobacteria bacterium RIFCSPLOWO2_02_FULL_46_8]